MKHSKATIALIAGTVTLLTAVPASGQATINSTSRSTWATALDDRIFTMPEESDMDSELSESTGFIDHQVEASVTSYAATASQIGVVSPNLIAITAAADSEGGFVTDSGENNARSGVDIEIQFSIAQANPFSLDLTWSGMGYDPTVQGSVEFRLFSDSETIASASNLLFDEGAGTYQSIPGGTIDLDGILAPGDYTLTATLQSVLGIIPASKGDLQTAPAVLDFELAIPNVPGPSAALLLACSAGCLNGRRRR